MTWLRITLLHLKSILAAPGESPCSATRLRLDAHAICQTAI
jgi:hypothetical protein